MTIIPENLGSACRFAPDDLSSVSNRGRAMQVALSTEAFISGSLALSQRGEFIILAIPDRALSVKSSDDQFADTGCGFDLLPADYGAPMPKPEIN